MRNLVVFITLALIFVFSISMAPRPSLYTFQENFDGTAVDYAKWSPHFRWGDVIINDELQAYTPNNFIVSNGSLKIQARHEVATYGGQVLQYTSGVLTSLHQQIYGKWEIRAKMPGAGMGYWPAFWLRPVDSSKAQTFILFEYYGAYPDYQTMVYWDAAGTEIPVHVQSPSFADQWHVYAIEWRANFVRATIDDVEVGRVDAPTEATSMYMILNFAISSQEPMGPPTGVTEFPAVVEIDYIRVKP